LNREVAVFFLGQRHFFSGKSISSVRIICILFGQIYLVWKRLVAFFC